MKPIKPIIGILALILFLVGPATIVTAETMTIGEEKVEVLHHEGRLSKYESSFITIDNSLFKFNLKTRFIGPDGTVLSNSQSIMNYSRTVKIRYYFPPNAKEGDSPVLLSVQTSPPE